MLILVDVQQFTVNGCNQNLADRQHQETPLLVVRFGCPLGLTYPSLEHGILDRALLEKYCSQCIALQRRGFENFRKST
jgi:hypothetical protein